MNTRFIKTAFFSLLLSLSSYAAPIPGQDVAYIKSLIDANTQTSHRSLSDLSELKIATYNLLNWTPYESLFLKDGKILQNPWNPREDKPMGQRLGVAKKILEMNPDILMVQELRAPTGGIEKAKIALTQLNDDFLGSAYNFIVTETNDGRGLYVAALIKKDLNLEIESRTYTHRSWVDPVNNPSKKESPLFSRDLLTLILRVPGNNTPKLILQNTHFKSKRDREGDPESRIWAKAQVDEAAKIYKELQEEFPQVPYILSGDLNGHFYDEKEFKAFKGLLTPSQDADKDEEKPEDRVTHYYFPPQDGTPVTYEIDMHLLSKEVLPYVLDAQTQVYLDSNGNASVAPKSFQERSRFPSDHRAVLLKLNADILR